jgi:hypothetical protein
VFEGLPPDVRPAREPKKSNEDGSVPAKEPLVAKDAVQ